MHVSYLCLLVKMMSLGKHSVVGLGHEIETMVVNIKPYVCMAACDMFPLVILLLPMIIITSHHCSVLLLLAAARARAHVQVNVSSQRLW